MINFLFYILICTVTINHSIKEVKNKLLVNILCFMFYFYFNYQDIESFMVILILYLNYIYILLNIFTTRYSSIRIKIIECFTNNVKMIDNDWLFDDRNKRLSKKLKSRLTLKFISTIIIIFRKVLVK